MILGISNDPPAKNLKFKEKYSFPYDLLCDEDNAVGIAYGAAEEREAKSLKRISYLIGPDGLIKKVYGTVKTAEHPDQVLRDLNG